MALSKVLLETLVCPICLTSVKPNHDQTGVKCTSCRRVYPVREGIPVMLPSDAAIEAD